MTSDCDGVLVQVMAVWLVQPHSDSQLSGMWQGTIQGCGATQAHRLGQAIHRGFDRLGWGRTPSLSFQDSLSCVGQCD